MESIGEKVRQKPALSIFDSLNIADKPECLTVAYTSDHGIQADSFKIIHIRLNTYPVVTQKHHGFLAVLMYYIHHFLCKLRHFSSLEIYKIKVFLARYSVGIVHISLIYYIFRSESVSHFFFKQIQYIRAYRG